MAESHLRVIPLGGLGEIGKNMMALEVNDDIVVVDCGVMFPEEDMPGVDLVLPDISYLVEHRKKVRAILITHGHEDHIGALPYVLPQLEVPVYAPRLAHGLISVKLKELRRLRHADLREVEPGKVYKIGRLKAEWFRVCHSIPDAMGIILSTPLGTVVHTGDFKIDHTPVDGRLLDMARLARAGEEGVFLLFSDSTYAELPGYTPSESVLIDPLDRVVAQAPGRVLVTTFASLISRMQIVINAAARYGRKVAVVGRSMVDNVNFALKAGYLSAPPGTIVPLEEAKRLPPERVVLLTTGSQGEPTSVLVRIANRDHRDIKVVPGDTIVISATPIPGNELVVSRTIDNLYRQGANVLYHTIATVHVHGHASQEELKTVLNLVRPRYFVPVHGEYRHLVAHKRLAQTVGMPEEHVFVLEDGDVLEFTSRRAAVVGRVPAGHIYVDGLRVWDPRSVVYRDRRMLAREGIVVVIIPVDKATGRPVRTPDVVSSGFVEEEQARELSGKVAELVMESLDHREPVTHGAGSASHKVKETVSRYLYNATGRRPMIIPVLLEV